MLCCSRITFNCAETHQTLREIIFVVTIVCVGGGGEDLGAGEREIRERWSKLQTSSYKAIYGEDVMYNVRTTTLLCDTQQSC